MNRVLFGKIKFSCGILFPASWRVSDHIDSDIFHPASALQFGWHRKDTAIVFHQSLLLELEGRGRHLHQHQV